MADELKSILVGAEMVTAAAKRGRELAGHDNPPRDLSMQARRIAAIADGAAYLLEGDDDLFVERQAFAAIAQTALDLAKVLKGKEQ